MTCESSDRPLYAATVRVVRLDAMAIDQSVSPGATVWATCPCAGAAVARTAAAARRAGIRRVMADTLPATPANGGFRRGFTVTCKRAPIGAPLAIGDERAPVALEVRVVVEGDQRRAAAAGDDLGDPGVHRDAVEGDDRLDGHAEQRHARGGEHP